MKKNKTVIYLCMALITALFFVCLRLFILELYQNNWAFDSSMVRTVIILFGLILSFLRLLNKARSKYPLEFYASSYSEQIGNAFSTDAQRKEKKELLKALASYSENDPQKAIKRLNSLRKECKTTDDYKVVLLFLGLSYTDLYMITDAINAYNELLTYDAFYPTAWSNLGILYKDQRNFKEAIRCYENSTRFYSDYSQGWNNLAQLYIQTGEWEKAITPAEKALSINPKMYQAESALAIAYFALKEEEKSKQHFQNAVALGSKPENIKSFMELISSGRFALNQDEADDDEDYDDFEDDEDFEED